MSRLKKYWNRYVRWFDRSFSSGWGRQVMFLCGALLIVLMLSTIALHVSPAPREGDKMPLVRALELMLDPGSFNDSDSAPFTIVTQLLVTLVGAVFFTAMLITVLGNIVSNRIQNFKKGRVRYRFDDHVARVYPDRSSSEQEDSRADCSGYGKAS